MAEQRDFKTLDCHRMACKSPYASDSIRRSSFQPLSQILPHWYNNRQVPAGGTHQAPSRGPSSAEESHSLPRFLLRSHLLHTRRPWWVSIHTTHQWDLVALFTITFLIDTDLIRPNYSSYNHATHMSQRSMKFLCDKFDLPLHEISNISSSSPHVYDIAVYLGLFSVLSNDTR
jgi:hypothetical protein